MSAFGYKRTYSGQLANVRFTPKSGHSNRYIGGSGLLYVQGRERMRSEIIVRPNVRFTPVSGRK